MDWGFKIGIGCDVKMSTRGLRFHSAAIHYFDADAGAVQSGKQPDN